MRAIHIGEVLGVDVNIHPTFVLVLIGAVLYWGVGDSGGIVPALLGLLLVVLVFLSVLAHELAHAVIASEVGVNVLDVTLWPLSGVARIEQHQATPRNELMIALAGPAANLAIVVALLPAVLMVGVLAGADTFAAAGPNFRNLNPVTMLSTIAILNLGLMLFNLLPAFPLDGGRVLRASLSEFVGRKRATLIATQAGYVITAAFLLLGIWLQLWILPFFGLFIIFAARAESQLVRVETQLRNMQVGAYALWDMGGVSPRDPLTYALRGGPRDVAVTDRGRVVGMLWRTSLLGGLHGGVRGRSVSDVMDRDIYVADVSDSIFEVHRRMNDMQLWAVPVTEDGLYRGIFTADRYVGLYRQVQNGSSPRNWEISQDWKDAVASTFRRKGRRRV